MCGRSKLFPIKRNVWDISHITRVMRGTWGCGRCWRPDLLYTGIWLPTKRVSPKTECFPSCCGLGAKSKLITMKTKIIIPKIKNLPQKSSLGNPGGSCELPVFNPPPPLLQSARFLDLCPRANLMHLKTKGVILQVFLNSCVFNSKKDTIWRAKRDFRQVPMLAAGIKLRHSLNQTGLSTPWTAEPVWDLEGRSKSHFDLIKRKDNKVSNPPEFSFMIICPAIGLQSSRQPTINSGNFQLLQLKVNCSLKITES